MNSLGPRLLLPSFMLAALLLAGLVSWGCASRVDAPPPGPAAPPGTAQKLAAKHWSASSSRMALQQAVLFERGKLAIAMTGLMLLDTSRAEARVVAMNEMGLKLFDITVTGTGHQAHFLLPDFARRPEFVASLAESVRRLFLAPAPAATDAAHLGPGDEITLLRPTDRGRVRFTFDAATGNMTTKGNPAARWRARYSEYETAAGAPPLPREARYRDDRAGFGLTVRTTRMIRQ